MAISKINTRALANDSVTTEKVADNAITTDMVASGEIGVTDLADGSITNAKVSTTAAIAASKVDLSSIAGNVDLASGALQIGGNTVINSSRQAFFTAATGSSLKLERSDVGHGMTAIAETATFGHLTAEGGANGGLRITALADTASTSAFNVSAYAHTPSTDGNAAVIRLRGSKKNGTGEQAIADSEDLLSIGNVGTERIIVKGNGDFQVNGTTVINSSQVGFLNEKTRIGTGATYPTDNAQLYIQRSNNNPYIGFFSNDGSRNAYLQSVGSGAFYLNNAEGGGWAFNNSTSDVLSITNTGAILGTDKLQITPGGTNYAGGSNTFASGAAVEIYAETLNTSSLLIANNSGNAHTWFNYENGNNYITGDASNNTGDTIFRTYTANPDNYSEKVFFKANGEVHIGGNGSENSTSSFSFMGTGGDSYLNFNMDGRASPVTSLNGAYIWSGQGASGDYRAGDLAIQSRSNQSRSVHVVTGTTPTKRWSAHGNGDISQYKSAQHGYTYYTNAATIDTDFTAADGFVFEVVGYVNPNSGGSNYNDVFHGHIYIGHGWSGSALTHYAYFVMLTPPAREVYNSGSNASGNDIDIVLNNNGTETTSVPQSDASNWNIRLKASNYNTTYGSGFGASITRKI